MLTLIWANRKKINRPLLKKLHMHLIYLVLLSNLIIKLLNWTVILWFNLVAIQVMTKRLVGSVIGISRLVISMTTSRSPIAQIPRVGDGSMLIDLRLLNSIMQTHFHLLKRTVRELVAFICISSTYCFADYFIQPHRDFHQFRILCLSGRGVSVLLLLLLGVGWGRKYSGRTEESGIIDLATKPAGFTGRPLILPE